jgi:single-strand DNA-binding protein
MSSLRMPQINDLRLSGRVARDAAVRTISTGRDIHNVTEFSLAVDRGFGDKRQTMFVQVQAWDKTGERAALECKKGTPIILDGELWREEWTDKEGHKQSKTRVTMRRFHVLAWADESSHAATPNMGTTTDEDGIPF